MNRMLNWLTDLYVAHRLQIWREEAEYYESLAAQFAADAERARHLAGDDSRRGRRYQRRAVEFEALAWAHRRTASYLLISAAIHSRRHELARMGA